MLEPVVQQVNRGAEMMLGEAAGQIPVGRDHHDGAGELARQHERLVAGAREIGAKPVASRTMTTPSSGSVRA